jgi:hypothetical protein
MPGTPIRLSNEQTQSPHAVLRHMPLIVLPCAARNEQRRCCAKSSTWSRATPHRAAALGRLLAATTRCGLASRCAWWARRQLLGRTQPCQHQAAAGRLQAQQGQATAGRRQLVSTRSERVPAASCWANCLAGATSNKLVHWQPNPTTYRLVHMLCVTRASRGLTHERQARWGRGSPRGGPTTTWKIGQECGTNVLLSLCSCDAGWHGAEAFGKRQMREPVGAVKATGVKLGEGDGK